MRCAQLVQFVRQDIRQIDARRRYVDAQAQSGRLVTGREVFLLAQVLEGG